MRRELGETPLTSSTSEGDDVSGVSSIESPLLDEFFLCDENETATIDDNGSSTETVGLTNFLDRDRLIGNKDAHRDLATSLSHHLRNLRGSSNEP